MGILTDIFVIIGGAICACIALCVIVDVVYFIIDKYRNSKSIPYFRSVNTKCFKCGSVYTISARSCSKDTYDAFCPFCGNQTYVVSSKISDKFKRKR